ncbi:hypothetical protein X801_00853, partial [Opisthorchis viverrini]
MGVFHAEGQVEVVLWILCPPVTLPVKTLTATFDYMVSCHVRYWKGAWTTLHETTDVHDCDLIPIKSTSPNEKRMKVDRKLSQKSNLQCVNSREERLVKLFADQMNLEQPYEMMAVNEVEESPVPGKRLTFTSDPNQQHIIVQKSINKLAHWT